MVRYLSDGKSGKCSTAAATSFRQPLVIIKIYFPHYNIIYFTLFLKTYFTFKIWLLLFISGRTESPQRFAFKSKRERKNEEFENFKYQVGQKRGKIQPEVSALS